jgi:large subunit ribosomal protein L33
MAKKQNRIQVILECTSCRKSGLPGVSRYVSIKNRANTTDRIELKKYCKFERKHTVHKEIK